MRLTSRWIAPALLVAGAAVVPLAAAGYPTYIASVFLIWSIVGLGVNLLTGFAGQLSLGHAGIFALGAYGVAVLMTRGWDFWLAWPVVSIAASLFGVVVSLPAMRLTGVYLAVATLALGEVVVKFVYEWQSVTGGAGGINVPRPTLQGLPLNDAGVYWIILTFTVGLTWLAANLARGRTGRAWLSLHRSEVAAEAIGIYVPVYKVLAFSVSAFFTATGGALYAILLGRLSPDPFTVTMSIYFLAMVVFGGMASLPGTFLGAAVVVVAPEALRGIRDLQATLFGVVMVVLMVLAPGGLAGSWKGVAEWLRKQHQAG